MHNFFWLLHVFILQNQTNPEAKICRYSHRNEKKKKKNLKNTQMLNKLEGHREKPLGREEAIS